MRAVLSEEAVSLLKNGNVGILPTDTLYGLVASALDREAVERVYRVRARDEGKPCIVLVSDRSDIEKFFGLLFSGLAPQLEGTWPGKVSMILPCPDEEWKYLHRGTKTIAFRVPDKPELREILRKTGPLIAPSANPQGKSPAKTIEEAEEYFGDTVDFYVDGGMLDSEPSTVVRFMDGKLSVVREGAVKISNQDP